MLSAVNSATAAVKRPKGLPREIGLRPIQLCVSLVGPRVRLRRQSAYRGKAAIFTLPEYPMALSPTQHAHGRLVSVINESSAAAFELSLAVCARRA